VRFWLFALLAASATLAGVSAVHAQGVEITGLICVGDAEIVSIKNNGGAPQNLAGWTLFSDPEATEWFDLSVVGTLAAGAGITVFSGPDAPDTDPPFYLWTLQYRYRDLDPTDYARVVNDQSSEIDKVNCPAVEPTITPEPTPTPTIFPVGGIAELPDVSGPSNPDYMPLAGLAAAALALLAAGACYAGKRFRQG
jgi:hypothetical protein